MGLSYTKEYLIPYQKVRENVPPGNVKKLYLSRKNMDLGAKKIHGERYFEDFFVAHGFTAISPEKLSMEEQLSLIVGADEIVAITGTLTHWALFCKPTTKFIMLSRTEQYGGWQLLVNDATKIDAYVINCVKNFLHVVTASGAMLFAATKCWKDFVANYFNEQIDEDDDYLYFDEALQSYLVAWFEKYADKKDLQISSVKKLCNRIITLERKLTANRPLLTYIAHVAKNGWQNDWKVENQLVNPPHQKFDIQAVMIDFTNPLCDVYYSVYYNEKEGWTQEVSNGQIAGTVGKSKPIFGIKIRLDEVGEKKFDILYRVHKFNGEWTHWARNGEEIISDQKLNSLQIKLTVKQTFTIDVSKPNKIIVADN